MLLIFSLLIASAVVSTDVSANVQSSLQDLNAAGLPESIQNSLQDLNLGALPTNLTDGLPIEEAEKVLEQKCRENSGSDEAYAAAKQASLDAQECAKGIVDFEEVQEEIEKKKKTGDLDLVFKKYCQKKPIMKDCITNLTRAFEPCLDDEEKATQATAINVTNSLLEFICHKDGDRIALFIAEGGPDCINASLPQIKTCVETIFNVKIEGETPSLDTLPQLVLKAEECDKFTLLQKCVVKDLETCKETTPANVVDALFDFVRKQTPCQAKLLASRSHAAFHSLSAFGILTSLVLALAH